MLFLFAVFRVNSLNFLAHEVHVVFQFLHLTVHLVNQAVALLRRCVQESEIVLVGLHFLFDGLVLAEQACALVVECIFTAFCHVFQVALKAIQTTAGSRDVQILVELVEHFVILLIELVLLLVGYMTNRLILVDQLLHSFLHIVASLFGSGFQLGNDTALLGQVGMLLTACSRIGSVASLEELVACREEVVP